MSIKFQAGDKKIQEILFSTENFRIPSYQRPYSWGKDEATDFRNDIISSENGYFIGSFVLNYERANEEDIVDIIDGQQRSLTITIFLSIIRNYLNNIGETDMSKQIQQNFIAQYDFFEKKTTYRITTGDSTKDFFEKYIQNEPEYDREKNIKRNNLSKEEKAIFDVYLYFKDQILLYLKSREKDTSRIKQLIDKLMTLKAIWIRIEDESDAYTIFESVNARGADLTASDLVKNLIFKHFDKKLNKLEEAKKIWGEIESNINDSGGDMSKFLRHYRLSKYNYIGEKEVFKEIKNNVQHNDYEIFLEDIYKQSFFYKIILNPNNSTDNDLINLIGIDDRKINRKISNIFYTLQALNTFRIKQFAPIFLSIFRNIEIVINLAAPYNLFDNIEKFAYIYFGISSLPARAIEKEGSNVAKEINKICNDTIGKSSSARLQSEYNRYKEFLKSLLPSFEEFEKNFGELSYNKGGLVKYTLVRISNNIERKETLDDILDYNKINLEHILPQDPKLWGLYKYQINSFVNKIGNLTLIGVGMNSSVGNKILKDKTEDDKGFKQSKITMTIQLVDYFRKNNYSWNEEEINKRTKQLCEQIYHIQLIK